MFMPKELPDTELTLLELYQAELIADELRDIELTLLELDHAKFIADEPHSWHAVVGLC